MASEQFSLRLPEETKDRLEVLAKSMGHTKSFLALTAIEQYLDAQSWQVSAIQKGLNDIKANKTVSIDEIKKDWELN